MKKILPFLIVFLSFLIQKSYATHALGGDLMYEQTAPNEYLVTLRIYRDCNGINLNNNVTINWSGTCGNGNASASRISNLDITPLCPSLPTACAGGSGAIGIEEHIYTTTITVPLGCNDINFSYSLCCRNNAITTLIDPGNENIFLYTEHVNTGIINHSPFFNNYPSPIVCVNQPVVYNHGVYDPDGDSLYFFQGNCYEALNDVVEYSPGFSGTTPLSTVNPIVLNPNTGAISFTPNTQQVGVMCIVVQEFRNGVLIGETIRDIQFNVIACNNVPPVSSGINNQPGVDSLDFLISICENSLVCFDLSFSDTDLDVLTVSWNQEINDATFQVTNNNTIAPTAQFCWSPETTDLGLNFFSINIRDDACPIVGNSTYTYTVQVLPNPNSMSLTYDNTLCVADTNQILITTFPNPADSVYWLPNPSLDQTTLFTADVFPIANESFILEAFFADGCAARDTAILLISPPPNITANANTTNICNGGSIVLSGGGGSSYTWNNGALDGVPFVPPVGTTTYIVNGVDANNCTNQDSLQITVNPILDIIALPGTNLCEGDYLTLNAQGASTYLWNNGVVDGVPFVPPVGSTTYIVTGTDVNGCVSQDSISIYVNPLPSVLAQADANSYCEGDMITLTGQNASAYSWDNGVLNNTPFTQAPGTSIYTLTGTDNLGCVNQDTIAVTVTALPNVMANAASSVVCEDVPVLLSGSGAATYTWNNGVVDGIPFIQAVGTNTYTLTGVDVNGCANQDSIEVQVNPLPVVVANTNANGLCLGSSVILSGSGAQSYTWDNSVSDGVPVVPSVGVTTYTVTGTDINGCVNIDAIDVNVNPLPVITINSSANGNALCDGESLVLTASGAQTYTWNNGVTNGVSFIPPVGTTTYTVIAVDANGCVSTDSISVLVNPLPLLSITASDTEVCIGESVILNGSGAQTYVWDNGVVDGISFVPLVGTSTYTLTATDFNSCVNQTSIDITANPLPVVVANTSANGLCLGSSLTLSGSGAQSYTWDNGVVDGIAFTPYVGTTTYTVIGIDSNACQNQANIDVVVNALPPVAVQTNSTGNEICEGTAITLSGSGAQSYSWNNGVQDGISFVPPVGNTIYVLTGMDANACVNSDTIEIIVNPLPVVTAQLSANNVCDGDSVTLSCSNLAFHSWNYNVVDGVPFVPPVGTTRYILTAMDLNGCVNEDSIDVVVNPLPNVLANSTDNQVCEGNTIALFGSGAATYVWNNGVINGLAFSPPIGVSTYKVIGTDFNGCTGEDEIAIQAYESPTLSPISSDNIVCEGEEVTLIGAGAQTYTWNNGVTNGVPFVPNIGLNTFIVTGTDANSCSSSDTIQVVVHPLPDVVANASANIICEGSSIQLFGSGANSYVWDGGVVDGANVIPSLGVSSYTVIGIDINNCMNTDTIEILTNGHIDFAALEDVSVCEPEQLSITNISSNILSYQWGVIENGIAIELINDSNYSGVQTEQLQVMNIAQASTQTYFVQLTGLCDEVIYDTVNVMIHEAPIVDLLEDTVLCMHENNIIFADLPNAGAYVWNDGTVGQYLVPEYTGMYYVNALENETACVISDTLYVEMEDCIDACVLVAPSGFSPNGDGTNDGFSAIHTCDEGMSFFDMKIFNRWGELVFRSSEPNESWNGMYMGTQAPIGTYAFVIDYVKEYSNAKEFIKGNVSLIR